MNRNKEAHFSQLPKVEIQRSLFDMSGDLKTSFNIGELIPMYAEECLPGDTFSNDTNIVIRTTSPLIKPVMDNLFLDIYYFAVPMRLVWEHFEEFMGENKTGPWAQKTEYIIPQVKAPTNGWEKGTLADYFTIPTKVSNISISALYARAYALIWNEYFRDENLQNPTEVPTGDATVQGVNTGTLETDACKYGKPLPVNKIHDYFTSCLPTAQKGNEVLLPLGTSAPVTNELNANYNNSFSPRWIDENANQLEEKNYLLTGEEGEENLWKATMATKNNINQSEKNIARLALKADLTSSTAVSINQLREAFAIQALLETDARGGTRYTEIIRAHFGVISADARLQRPEYLGGKRIPLNIAQVVQTSGTQNQGAQVTPQGNLSAISHTFDSDSSFTKSFTEHSLIIGLMAVRTQHTYQQGIDRKFSRKRRYKFYWKELANLGEQPVKNKEIYAQGNDKDEETFGFQEAWGDYRYRPNKVTGQMRSNAEGTLDIMHFADNYNELPKLGQDWIQETKANLDRCLAVPSSKSDQFIAELYFKVRAARPMPTYPIPATLGRN